MVPTCEPKTRTGLLSFKPSIGTSHCGRSLRDRCTKLPIPKFSFDPPLFFQSHDAFHKAIKKRDSKCDIPVCWTVCHTFPNQGTASWSNTVYMQLKYFRDISRPMWPRAISPMLRSNSVKSFSRYGFANASHKTWTDPESAFYEAIIETLMGKTVDLAFGSLPADR